MLSLPQLRPSSASAAALLALLCMTLTACGGQTLPASATGAASATTSTPSASDPASGILGYGHAAPPAQAAVIVQTLRGFLAAQAAANGPRTCTYLMPALRAQAAGPNASCAASFRTMFARQRSRMRAALRATQVTAVRVDGVRAFVVFHQSGGHQAFFPLFRERNAWKLGAIGLTVLP
jgi:hypothetical protein